MTEKLRRKIVKSQYLLKRHEDISTSDIPTCVLYVGNGGVLNGVGSDDIELAFCSVVQSCKILSPEGKPYCFAILRELDEAEQVFEKYQGYRLSVKDRKIQLFLSYIEGVPSKHSMAPQVVSSPAGLQLLENFITAEEEQLLLDSLQWPESNTGGHLKQRLVQHFGYEFLYSISSIDPEKPLNDRPIPSTCIALFDRFQQLGLWQSLPPDQLTVNHYSPGQGIPPHIDTHSAFVDEVVSLSLSSDVVMSFSDCRVARHNEYSLLLPRRSLLVLGGDSRYCWTHGITSRKHDMLSRPGAATRLQARETRVSYTFRRLRRGPCDCRYPKHCDSQMAGQSVASASESGTRVDPLSCESGTRVDPLSCESGTPVDPLSCESSAPNVTSSAWKPRSEDEAASLEKLHVHKVYDEIASNFSDTRHTPWPKVKDFVSSLPPGSILCDVGCGNGKYLGINDSILKIGLDASLGLCEISAARDFQTTLADILHVPLRSNCCDAAICIAVLHHLTTPGRRLAAIEELLRVVSPGGLVLITVWAMEQKQGSCAGDYVKEGRTPAVTQVPFECIPVHVNRTEFQAQDVLVPWHLKSKKDKATNDSKARATEVQEQTFHRFYHVFCRGELDELCAKCPNVTIVDSYYDRGNWGIVLKKMSEVSSS